MKRRGSTGIPTSCAPSISSGVLPVGDPPIAMTTSGIRPNTQERSSAVPACFATTQESQQDLAGLCWSFSAILKHLRTHLVPDHPPELVSFGFQIVCKTVEESGPAEGNAKAILDHGGALGCPRTSVCIGLLLGQLLWSHPGRPKQRKDHHLRNEFGVNLQALEILVIHRCIHSDRSPSNLPAGVFFAIWSRSLPTSSDLDTSID